MTTTVQVEKPRLKNGVFTRQRRRAEERAAKKHARTVEKGKFLGPVHTGPNHEEKRAMFKLATQRVVPKRSKRNGSFTKPRLAKDRTRG